jgi:ribosomal-protein-alanine N-acetyltransferase
MSTESDNLQVIQLHIRSMAPSDLDSVIRIEKQSFPYPWTREQFMTELGRKPVSRCHVAVAGDHEVYPVQDVSSFKGPVVGFIMAWLVEDELHITNLAVAPEARRGGVAAAILEHSILEAVEHGAVWCQLDVRASNTPARELYNRFGFKPLGTRKGYYHNGEDAVVMGRNLTSS